MLTEVTKRTWPVDLLDEILRVEGRFKSTFADFRRGIDLNESELMLLNALCAAEGPATVSQVARSMGYARQLIQRAANALLSKSLIESLPNPDHKRAALLQPSAQGWDLKRKVNARAQAVADALQDEVDVNHIYAAISAIRTVRKALEGHQRADSKKPD